MEKYIDENVTALLNSNIEGVNHFIKWLLDFNDNAEFKIKNDSTKRTFLNNDTGKFFYYMICGSDGCGKTTLLNKILKDIGYTSLILNLEYVNKIVNAGNFTNVLCQFSRGNIAKKLIIIDNINNFEYKPAMSFIDDLVYKNSVRPMLPIVIINNLDHDKNIVNLKKNAYVLNLPKPSNIILKKIFCQIIKDKNIKIKSDILIDDFISVCVQDYHIFWINVNEFIKSKLDILDYCKVKVDRVLGNEIFDLTKKILMDNQSYNGTMTLYENYKKNAPDMFIENYLTPVLGLYKKVHRSSDMINIIDLAINISDNIMTGDALENHVNMVQTWGLRDVYGTLISVNNAWKIKNNRYWTKSSGYMNITFKSSMTVTFAMRKNNKSLNANETNITNVDCILLSKCMIDTRVNAKEPKIVDGRIQSIFTDYAIGGDMKIPQNLISTIFKLNKVDDFGSHSKIVQKIKTLCK